MSFFVEFQDTVVGSSELTIRTIVPPIISAEPYRKVMIEILFLVAFFLSFLLLLFLFLRNFTTTVAVYFSFLTDSAECIVDSIHHDVSTLTTFKASGSSIYLGNQRWYRI